MILFHSYDHKVFITAHFETFRQETGAISENQSSSITDSFVRM